MAYSVEGQSVTLYLDCEKVDTMDLLRGPDPEISTGGVTVFGTRLLDEEVFEVRAPAPWDPGVLVVAVVCVHFQGPIRTNGAQLTDGHTHTHTDRQTHNRGSYC